MSRYSWWRDFVSVWYECDKEYSGKVWQVSSHSRVQLVSLFGSSSMATDIRIFVRHLVAPKREEVRLFAVGASSECFAYGTDV